MPHNVHLACKGGESVNILKNKISLEAIASIHSGTYTQHDATVKKKKKRGSHCELIWNDFQMLLSEKGKYKRAQMACYLLCKK